MLQLKPHCETCTDCECIPLKNPGRKSVPHRPDFKKTGKQDSLTNYFHPDAQKK
eukprot:m.253686 g.253686  ORF g.253686 m.253686 type:complete len:54 (-) comp16162_c0_seq6:173-334(-)